MVWLLYPSDGRCGRRRQGVRRRSSRRRRPGRSRPPGLVSCEARRLDTKTQNNEMPRACGPSVVHILLHAWQWHAFTDQQLLVVHILHAVSGSQHFSNYFVFY
jgi:hypothetical protein